MGDYERGSGQRDDELDGGKNNLKIRSTIVAIRSTASKLSLYVYDPSPVPTVDDEDRYLFKPNKLLWNWLLKGPVCPLQ